MQIPFGLSLSKPTECHARPFDRLRASGCLRALSALPARATAGGLTEDGLDWIASASCGSVMAALPARSAMLRATRSVRW